MRNYQCEFLDFAINTGVLRFGSFTLKSGRVSPYFFDTGLFNTGDTMARLGRYYAEAIMAARIEFDMLFGPAYKGIPLVVATAIALAEHHGRSVPYAFDRKEAKDHGEGGTTVGARIQGRVLLIDDVISAGTSVRAGQRVIHASGGKLIGVAIALNRQERGQGDRSAIREVEEEIGVRVISIAALGDLIALLKTRPAMRQALQDIQAYREAYGE